MANLVKTNLTLGGASPYVNLDNVLQVSKSGSGFTGSDGNPSAPQNRFGISFAFADHSQNPQNLTWRYESESVRNSDFQLIFSENNQMGNLFLSTLSVGGNAPIVNLNNVLQVSKRATLFTGSNGNPSTSQNRFSILMTFSGQGQNPQYVELMYASEANMNTDYAAILSQQVEPGGVQTLQQVLDNNHNLAMGVNTQGTNAGDGQTGADVNAFGEQAAKNNSGSYVNALGFGAADGNTGGHCNFLGNISGGNNEGNHVNVFGTGAAVNNEGNDLNALGQHCSRDNKGDFVNAFGPNAARENEGDNVNAFGSDAAYGNTIDGQTIFSNSSFPVFANQAAAELAITEANGASVGCTYLYLDSSDSTVKGVRLV